MYPLFSLLMSYFTPCSQIYWVFYSLLSDCMSSVPPVLTSNELFYSLFSDLVSILLPVFSLNKYFTPCLQILRQFIPCIQIVWVFYSLFSVQRVFCSKCIYPLYLQNQHLGRLNSLTVSCNLVIMCVNINSLTIYSHYNFLTIKWLIF